MTQTGVPIIGQAVVATGTPAEGGVIVASQIGGLSRRGGMELGKRSDAELLAGDAPGDYGSFYDRHLAVVSSYVASRVRQPELMFDLVAETFARALERRAQFDPARGPAVGWLLGIARNLIADSARRGQVEAASRVRLGMAAVELDDEQLARIVELGRGDLRALLGSIPADQREAVLRRVVLDESYTTIAGQVRCSEQVVRKRVSRGLASLRANLEERK
jgi:RNA polymerase sigma factor (sigma-70 family)